MRIKATRWFTLTMALLLAGCAQQAASPHSDYQTLMTDPQHNTTLAQQDNTQAIALIADGKNDEAEKTLKKALEADILYGPAHNNLGLLYYHQDKYYLAAWEFEYAGKLMPDQAEPRNNLGLVFEAAGKDDDAIKWYQEALGIAPDNVQIMENLARARVHRGDTDESVRKLLSDIVLRDAHAQWSEWAKEKLALMKKPSVDAPAMGTQP